MSCAEDLIEPDLRQKCAAENFCNFFFSSLTLMSLDPSSKTQHKPQTSPQAREKRFAAQHLIQTRRLWLDQRWHSIARQLGGRSMCVQWEGYECGETIGFCTLTHLFPLQKGFTYHSPKGWYRFIDVISATHQHYNDQLCLQLLLQPSLAKLKTFFIYLSRD